MTRHLTLTAALLTVGLSAPFVLAQDEPPPAPPPAVSIAIASDDEAAPEAPPQETGADRRVERRRAEIIQPDGPGGEPRKRVAIAVAEAAEPAIPPNSAWLGVQLSPVPAALAYHLDLKDTGAMVANIFEGSPADQAGLDRYDVIVKADGKPVPGGMEAVRKFAEHIRDKKPGDSLELAVVSHGREKVLRLELGKSPADWSRTRPKYAEDPDLALHREFDLRGRILRPGPGGEWLIEDLDKFPDFRQRLEREFRGQLEKLPGGAPLQDYLLRRERSEEVAVRVDKDGSTLQVQREPGGRIIVRRYRSGEEPDRNRKTYENTDQLRAADPEAFDLLQSAVERKPPVPVRPDVPGPKPLPPSKLPPASPSVKPFPAKPPVGPETRDPAQAWREWKRGFFQGPLKDARERPAAPEAPRTRFEIAPDGKITVHFRDADAELTRTYHSAEELRDQAPKLFKQYERMQDRMNAEE